MKKTLSTLVGLILLSPLALAVNDATISSGVIISVSGYNLTVNGEYPIDSITVGASSFDVTLVAGKAFGVTSVDRRKFTVSPMTYVSVSATCTSSESAVTINTTQGGGSITVTVTPSTSDLCSAGGDGGGIFGGGDGNIKTYNYGTTPAVPSSQAQEHASTVAQAVSPVFRSDLSFGNNNDDVKRLQQLLATDKEIYSEGLTTGFYGSLTRKAVIEFQKKYGLPQAGRVGPLTRAKLQEVFGNSAVTSAESTATIESLQVLITSLQKQIQDILKAGQQ